MADRAIKRALIAVYDKTGVTEFARALVDEFGIEIISTGGTAKHLKDAGVPVTMVEQVTGFPEMLDGRLKTLHPKIHAGILADRDNPDHMRHLAEHGIQPIDMVVVNLYPFEKTVADPNCTFEQAIEMIDIGGPCMLRAAAKNHRHVLVVISSREYSRVLDLLRANHLGELSIQSRWNAIQLFRVTSSYDRHIFDYLIGEHMSRDGVADGQELHPEVAAARSHRMMMPQLGWPDPLRYGENPHQQAQFASFSNGGESLDLRVDLESWGKDTRNAGNTLSYNNLVDGDAALGLCAEIARGTEQLHAPAVWHRLIAGATLPHNLSRKGTATPLSQLPPISDEQFTRRNLPHLQRPGATYFVTLRLRTGELSPDERDVVMECSLFPDGKKACIHAVTVMPDHVHIILTPLEWRQDEFYQLDDILHGVKGVSARRIVDLRKSSGAIWMDESWDRIIRDEADFFDKMEYVRVNPRTAGLGEDYPWVVYERSAGWHKEMDSAGVDLGHSFDIDDRMSEAGARSWHRLLAGATREGVETTREKRRGAIEAQSGIAHACVFIKHTNACGVGVAGDAIEAYRQAYYGDPNAAMGGILACNFAVDADFAAAVMETYDRFGKPLRESGHPAAPGGFFVEVWIAPTFSEEAMRVVRGTAEPTDAIPNPPKKAWGANVRLLAVGDMTAPPGASEMDYRRIAGGMLVQTRDVVGLNEDAWKVVTKRAPTEEEMADLRLAWLVCKHTKSNAITLCRDGMLIGNGAGQMSRVMSCRIATWLAKENGHESKLAGSAAASDAFFPFKDGPGILMDAGITAIIQPGGSKRDEETIAACDERGVAMVFTGTRHFRH